MTAYQPSPVNGGCSALSLIHKIRDVAAGQEVLGSGTESLAGIVSVSDGYFAVMAMYDFTIRDPLAVASMQVRAV